MKINMKLNILIVILGLLFFSACSNTNIEQIETNENNNFTKKNLSEENKTSEVIELTPLEIKEEKLKNISVKIEELQASENNTLGYGLVFGCSSLRYTYGTEKVEKCEEVRKKLDKLYHEEHIIETNTKNILKYSSEEIESLPFNLELLNINPSIIRFNLEQEVEFKLFLSDTDKNYECLFLNGTFSPGENIIPNDNNCYINSTKSLNLIIEYDNKVKYDDIIPDSDDFDFLQYKTILSPSHPELYGSNVTWELQILLNSSNDKSFKIVGLNSWISKRDVNGSYTDPEIIDNDPISGELLSKEFDREIILGKNDEKYFSWKFNYSDIPSPIPWSEFEYYYEIK